MMITDDHLFPFADDNFLLNNLQYTDYNLQPLATFSKLVENEDD